MALQHYLRKSSPGKGIWHQSYIPTYMGPMPHLQVSNATTNDIDIVRVYICMLAPSIAC